MRQVDRIRLEGVSCRVRLGVPESERRRPQTVLIDLSLELDLRRAGASDDVADSVDYWTLEQSLRRKLEAAEYRLVERLAEDAARVALASDPRVSAVSVAVRKRPVVMPKTEAVIVEIHRRAAR